RSDTVHRHSVSIHFLFYFLCCAGERFLCGTEVVPPRKGIRNPGLTPARTKGDMKPQRIGILHPGEMGISIAASAKNSGCEVYWTSEGRSTATQERVAKIGLHESRTLKELGAECPIVMSVCPPHAAEELANHVVATGFRGLFVDANAIAPQRTIKIAQVMSANDVSFVDGGIVGLPAWKPHTTRLYLSGDRA